MVRAKLRFALLTVLVAGAPDPASAQVSPLDIFGGLMGAAQAQAAREAWARLPGPDRSCLQRALATRNSDIKGLVRRHRAGRRAPRPLRDCDARAGRYQASG